MTAAATRTYRLGESHQFESNGHRFLYLVPAGAIFELDPPSAALIDRLSEGEAEHDRLVEHLSSRGVDDAEDLIEEMFQCHAIVAQDYVPEPVQDPPEDFPLDRKSVV